MNFIAFDKLYEFVSQKLQNELSENLYYHNWDHTLDVFNSATRISAESGLSEKELLLIQTAALLHDCGFLYRYKDNEPEAAKYSAEILPSFGYTHEQIMIVQNLILATTIPQDPQTQMQKILCDADLDYLGRDDFYPLSQRLKREWMYYGKPMNLKQWYKLQLLFLQNHQYFTPVSIQKREPIKRKNIEEIHNLLQSSPDVIEYSPSLSSGLIKPTGFSTIDTNLLPFLKKVDIFSNSSDEVLYAVAEQLKQLEVKAGDEIIRKGETGDCMYFLYKGKVRVHDGQFLIVELNPNIVFGEIALLDSEPRSASVTAISDCVLLRLDQKDFYKLLVRDSLIAKEIMRSLLNRIRNQNDQMINELKTREQKLISMVEERTSELRIASENLSKAFHEIENKNAKLEHLYNDIRDSVLYAKHIQELILPSMDIIRRDIPDCFVLYKPKDIVSGDFYWFGEKSFPHKIAIIAAGDCTGHGVPGAFMSMLGYDTLNQIVLEKNILDPSEILSKLNKNVRRSLKQKQRREGAWEGMDIALCVVDLKNKLLHYSGAQRPLYYFRKENPVDQPTIVSFNEIKPDKTGIGAMTPDEYIFKGHTIEIKPGDIFFIFTDGYADQFGGPERKKFMTKNLQKMLLQLQEFPFEKQAEQIERTFNQWRGSEIQTDDVLVIGMKF